MLGLALQGQSLLLISSDVSRLVPAAEALRALLFPLQWGAPLVFAPVSLLYCIQPLTFGANPAHHLTRSPPSYYYLFLLSF